MTRIRNVNRGEEIRWFTQLVRREVNERILLIQAESGMGKSRLLELCETNCPTHLKKVVIDFKNQMGLHDLLARITVDLGKKNFPQLSNAIRFSGKDLVHVEGNTLLGSNTIEVSLTAGDEDTREEKRVKLTEALFDDLEKLGQILFIFDTYNNCNETIGRWLCGHFLSRSRHQPNLLAVIAGQQVPEPALEWQALHHHIVLKEISPEHWHEYGASLGLTKSIDFYHGLCLGRKPAQIAMLLESQANSGQRSS